MYMFENRISLENREILDEYLNGFDYRTPGLVFIPVYVERHQPLLLGNNRRIYVHRGD